jgi:hypothetical protein
MSIFDEKNKQNTSHLIQSEAVTLSLITKNNTNSDLFSQYHEIFIPTMISFKKALN